MTKIKRKRIIHVRIEDELLKRIDASAAIVAANGAAFIRTAYQQRLKGLHRSQPEDLGWAESSARLLSKRLLKEKW